MTTVYRLELRLGTFAISGFGIMVMLAFVIGGWLVALELGRRRWNEAFATDIVVAAVVGGIVGAKLWYVALTRDPATLFSRSGLVWYGGFIGGVVAVIVTGWRRRVPIRATMQLVAPALAAAYAMGRVGCFVVGDDYGRPTDLPWGIRFPEGIPPSTAGNLATQFGVATATVSPSTVLAVHPTQLYEVALMLTAFMILWRWRLKPLPLGTTFAFYLMFAGIERFLVEFLRAKDDRFLGVFTIAQLTSGLGVVAGLALWNGYRKAPDPTPGPYLLQPRQSTASG